MSNALPNLDSSADFTDFGWLTALTPLGWTFFLVLFVCYFVRRIKRVPNVYMVPVILLGAIFFMFVGTDIPKYNPSQNAAIKAAWGIIVGIIGCLAAIGAHDKCFVLLASKWPLFSVLVADDALPQNNSNPKTP